MEEDVFRVPVNVIPAKKEPVAEITPEPAENPQAETAIAEVAAEPTPASDPYTATSQPLNNDHLQNQEPSSSPAPGSPVPPPNIPEPPRKKSRKKLLLILLFALLLVVAGYYYWTTHHKTISRPAKTNVSSLQQLSHSAPSNIQGVQLDTSKNYGNKYASGILPVGDSKYVTDTAKTGYIYACSGYAHNITTTSQAGAGKRGPWFVDTTQWDVNKKLAVQGQVTWVPSLSVAEQTGTRVISSNGLPNHGTGIFPIKVSDPAYAYDRNPNTISKQNLTYNLTLSPTYGTPQCMGGQAGIMLTGAALFNGFDAAGRDAGAWEVQDSCSGHPEKNGEYHYHTLSACIKDTSVSTIIGYALDGFPITGPKVADNNILTTADLDECHGLTSQLKMDNKLVTTYHYVMTQDFPYSVSCFRATPISPPGQQSQSPPPQN